MEYHEDRRQDEVPVCNFCKELYPEVCGSGVNCNCECHNCGCDHKSGFNDDYVDELEYGDIACSILINKEKSLSFNLCGIVDANKTPAIVACIPDL